MSLRNRKYFRVYTIFWISRYFDGLLPPFDPDANPFFPFLAAEPDLPVAGA